MASDVSYQSRLTEYARSMDRRRDRAVDALGHLGQAVARARARVRTGRMRREISFDGDTLHARAPYSVYMERGTRYVSAQPMMSPAADAMRARAGEEFERHFDPFA